MGCDIVELVNLLPQSNTCTFVGVLCTAISLFSYYLQEVDSGEKPMVKLQGEIRKKTTGTQKRKTFKMFQVRPSYT